MRQRAVDVIVIGAGVVGLASAYELAKRGRTVTVVERRGVAAGQSGRNWGFVRQQGRSAAELPLMVAANRRWRCLSDELDARIGWRQGGNLALAETPAAGERYRRWLETGRAHGVGSVLVDDGRVQEIVPGLRQPFDVALFAADDGGADPVATSRAYACAGERLGVQVLAGHEVRAVTMAGGRTTGVATDRGELAAGTVVCAAGAWTRGLLRAVGVQLPQSVVRSTVCLTSPVPPITRSTVWAPAYAFRQRQDGRVVLSDGSEGDVDVTVDMCRQAAQFLPALRRNWRSVRVHVGRAIVADPLTDRWLDAAYDPVPSRRRVARAVDRLRSVLPSLDTVTVEATWAGLIDATPDALPVLERVAERPGLVVATGFSGHGFGLAPVVGEVVADLVEGGDSGFDLAPFRLSRFRDGRVEAPEAIL